MFIGSQGASKEFRRKKGRRRSVKNSHVSSVVVLEESGDSRQVLGASCLLRVGLARLTRPIYRNETRKRGEIQIKQQQQLFITPFSASIDISYKVRVYLNSRPINRTFHGRYSVVEGG